MNKDKKPDCLEAIKYQKRIMIFTGMWPLEYRSLFYKIRLFVLFFVIILGSGVLTIELYVQTANIEVFTHIASVYTSLIGTLIKSVIFVCKWATFETTLKQLDHPILTQYPRELNAIMERTISVSSKISGFYQLSCVASVILLSGGRYLSWPVIPFFPITFIATDPMRNLFLHILETLTMMACACNNSCIDSVAGGLIAIATGHIRILNAAIKDASKWTRMRNDDRGIDDASLNKWLAHCVKYHIAVLSFIEWVERNFSVGFLLQFCASIIAICTVCFQMVHAPAASHFITMTMYFIAMIVQLSLYCWLGNELMLESTNTRDCCYLTDWVEWGTDVRRTLFIIMERTKRPVYLTAGKFANLSLDSFKSILKSAYSYFALIQTLYAKKERDAAI